LKSRLLPLLLLSFLSFPLGFEGKWTPEQLLQIDPAFLKQQGLELEPRKLWDPARGTGLLAATVLTPGCSGAFISPDGLFVTNHHCLFSFLQENSTPERDYITEGYLARSRDAELTSQTFRVSIPKRFTDVTAQILAAVPKKADDAARLKAIDRKQNDLVVACEKQPGIRCKVSAYDGGVSYILAEAFEVADVRLVWAPPRAVGEYGGEVDNWMWPRHTGDFAIGRLYVAPDGSSRTTNRENVPFKSEFYFPLSTKGISPGDFIMVLGYPGTTYRALTAAEMDERGQLWFPKREELFGEWIRIMEETPKGDPAGEIAVSDMLKTLQNRYKNAQGQIAGLARGRILEKQREADAAVLEWARQRPEHKGAVAAYGELAKVVEEQRRNWDHDFLLDQVKFAVGSSTPGPRALYVGNAIARASRQRVKPDVERNVDFMERNAPKLRAKVEREQKNFHAATDKALFISWVKRALALPKESRIAAVDRSFAGLSEPDIARKVEELYASSKLFVVEERMTMLGESEAQLKGRKDPLVDFLLALDEEIAELGRRRENWDGAISRLRPQWRRAVIAAAGKPVAPDANTTLRVTFGHVKGYQPRDGVLFVPQTTLSGLVAKHTGEEPFDVPESILSAARAGKVGRWKDERLGDVPVAFLSDADTTGGNSGSPTVNGRGELVGINFDRVWENVANDFGFNPDVARNVNADVRYMLWILDQVQNAEELLKELGVRK
jgi:hypothetical protein